MQALRGDLTDFGCIIDRTIEARARLMPEQFHEDLIRDAFEDYKQPCRNGDYFAYAFLCKYAKQQWVYPQRKDTAYFDPAYLGSGISSMTEAKILAWRETLLKASVEHRDAFEVLESLGPQDFAYLDPPYFSSDSNINNGRLYAHELIESDQIRLRDILYSANFPWMMSINDHGKTWDYYIHKGYTAIPIRYRVAPRRSKTPKYNEWLIMNY